METCLFSQQRKPMGSSAQNSTGVNWCRRRLRLNEVPEKVPKVPDKVWEASVQSPVEPDLAPPKPPGTFSGTFFRTLLDLTWLCAKTSQTFSGAFSGTFSGTLLNLTWPLHQSLC